MISDVNTNGLYCLKARILLQPNNPIQNKLFLSTFFVQAEISSPHSLKSDCLRPPPFLRYTTLILPPGRILPNLLKADINYSIIITLLRMWIQVCEESLRIGLWIIGFEELFEQTYLFKFDRGRG